VSVSDIEESSSECTPLVAGGASIQAGNKRLAGIVVAGQVPANHIVVEPEGNGGLDIQRI
jgi:hypothetical protein